MSDPMGVCPQCHGKRYLKIGKFLEPCGTCGGTGNLSVGAGGTYGRSRRGRKIVFFLVLALVIILCYEGKSAADKVHQESCTASPDPQYC